MQQRMLPQLLGPAQRQARQQRRAADRHAALGEERLRDMARHLVRAAADRDVERIGHARSAARWRWSAAPRSPGCAS